MSVRLRYVDVSHLSIIFYFIRVILPLVLQLSFDVKQQVIT